MTPEERESSRILDSLIARYLEAERSGQVLERRKLLAEHPALAKDLQEFFDVHDRMKAAANPLGATPQPSGSAEETRVDALTTGASVGGPTPEAEPPRTFGDYQLLEEIARGGMGVVYRARQISLNRIVALKMILAGQLAGQEDVQRFYSEAEAAANLDHPGIVPIFEIGSYRGQHYFSMSYVEGESLARKVSDGPLPPRQAAELVKKISDAMAYAHGQGVIHRDLKPANILVDRNGRPKVTDFGLAKRTETDAELTGTGQILGTPAFMPPEQAAGNPNVGPLADIYALGAILYCLLTGRPPFQAANQIDTLLQVVHGEPLPPRRLNPAVPLDLQTICLKCLQKEVGARYASAGLLSDDLQRFLHGEPLLARPAGPLERSWRWCRRKPLIAGLSLVVAVLLLVVMIAGPLIAWRQRQLRLRAEEATREAVLREVEALRRVRDSGYRELVWNKLAGIAGQTTSPAEHHRIRQAAVLCLGDFAGKPPLTITLDSADQKCSCAAFLGDGLLAVPKTDGSLAIYDAVQGGLVGELPRQGGPARQIEAAADGRTLYVSDAASLECWRRETDQSPWEIAWKHSYQGGLHLRFELYDAGARLATHTETTIYLLATGDGAVLDELSLETHLTAIDSLAVSPDGETLVAAGGLPIQVVVWRTRQQEVLKEFAPPTSGKAVVEFSPDGQYLALGSDQGFITYRTSDFTQWSLCRTNTITSLAFSPDSRYLLFPTVTGAVQLWSTATQQLAIELKHPAASRSGAVGFSPSGKRFFSGGGGALRVWSRDLREKTTLASHTQSATCVAFHPSAPLVVSGSKDGALILSNSQTGEQVAELDAGAPVQSVCFSHDGSLIAAGCWRPKPGAQIWNTARPDQAPVFLPGPGGRGVNGVRFSPDGSSLATTGDGGTALWEITPREAGAQRVIKTRIVAPYPGKHLLFDASSRFLVAISSDAYAWTVDQLLQGEFRPAVLDVDVPSGWKNLAFHRQKPWLYAVTNQQRVGVWALESTPPQTTEDPPQQPFEVCTAAPIASVFDEHPVQSYHLDVDHQSRLLAVASTPASISLLDLHSGEKLFQFREESSPIWAIAWDRNHTRLAVALADGGVVLWDVAYILGALDEYGFAGDLRPPEGTGP